MNGIHHVVVEPVPKGKAIKALCGRVVWHYDMPITIEHALACLEQGTYLRPCKNCMKILSRAARLPSEVL